MARQPLPGTTRVSPIHGQTIRAVHVEPFSHRRICTDATGSSRENSVANFHQPTKCPNNLTTPAIGAVGSVYPNCVVQRKQPYFFVSVAIAQNLISFSQAAHSYKLLSSVMKGLSLQHYVVTLGITYDGNDAFIFVRLF